MNAVICAVVRILFGERLILFAAFSKLHATFKRFLCNYLLAQSQTRQAVI